MIDLLQILILSLLEIALSADNAVVLSLLVLPLPAAKRRKALFIGLASAFFLRAAALFAISYMVGASWIQLIGACYLMYLSFSHLIKKEKKSLPSSSSFWKTVLLIEFFDFIFAIDSIVVGIAFVQFDLSKIWIVYLGGVIGLIAVRYGASLVNRLLARFAWLESLAYLFIGGVGFKLALSSLSQMV